MKEWLKADSELDVARFYDTKYIANGLEAFSNADRLQIIKCLQEYGGAFSEDKTLIDCGCGHGEFISMIYDRLTCYGIDVSSRAIDLALARRRGSFFNYHIMNAPESYEGMFDYVTCLGVIEHTMNPKEAFDRLMGFLKPTGVLIVSVPLIFEDCLSHLREEPNQKTNERFGNLSEWIDFFGQQVEWEFPNNSQETALLYRKENN